MLILEKNNNWISLENNWILLLFWKVKKKNEENVDLSFYVAKLFKQNFDLIKTGIGSGVNLQIIYKIFLILEIRSTIY